MLYSSISVILQYPLWLNSMAITREVLTIFCVTWNKGVRRMLNISNMKHTALLGQLINTCYISIQLVKRCCKFVDLMLTSRNAIVRHFVRRAIYSAQYPICRNIAVIRHRYAIHVIDINVKHVHRHYPLSHP